MCLKCSIACEQGDMSPRMIEHCDDFGHAVSPFVSTSNIINHNANMFSSFKIANEFARAYLLYKKEINNGVYFCEDYFNRDIKSLFLNLSNVQSTKDNDTITFLARINVHLAFSLLCGNILSTHIYTLVNELTSLHFPITDEERLLIVNNLSRLLHAHTNGNIDEIYVIKRHGLVTLTVRTEENMVVDATHMCIQLTDSLKQIKTIEQVMFTKCRYEQNVKEIEITFSLVSHHFANDDIKMQYADRTLNILVNYPHIEYAQTESTSTATKKKTKRKQPIYRKFINKFRF